VELYTQLQGRIADEVYSLLVDISSAQHASPKSRGKPPRDGILMPKPLGAKAQLELVTSPFFTHIGSSQVLASGDNLVLGILSLLNPKQPHGNIM
jgi:hypothetical protein